MKKLLVIVAMLAAGMVIGEGMPPRTFAEAQKGAKEKALENSRAVLQDQLRVTAFRPCRRAASGVPIRAAGCGRI